MSTPSLAQIPVWSGIGREAARFDAWLCDIWGVLHNGAAAFPGVVDACTRYRRDGGRILLVSNAPRPAAAVATQLERLGIGAACYDAILTSGDVTRDLLQAGPVGPVLHIGPERDLGIFSGLAIDRVDEHAARTIVCSGLYDDTTETAETYRPLLQRLLTRRLPMICANPDISVERGGQIIACAGAVAKLYGDLGGDVTYAGKPHAAVYSTARRTLATLAGRTLDPRRVLAIGDGVYTDIKGAAAAGYPALYVASRIYLTAPFSAAAVSELFAPLGFAPDAAMPALTW